MTTTRKQDPVMLCQSCGKREASPFDVICPTCRLEAGPEVEGAR
jgi:NMD protein affecting ribosome stability and mRNA decay